MVLYGKRVPVLLKKYQPKGMLPQKFIALLNPQNLGTFSIYEQLKQVRVGVGMWVQVLYFRCSYIEKVPKFGLQR